MLEEIGGAEERAAPAGGADEGVFEPFNLDAERETGSFDEEGNYSERKPDKDDDDAWLEGVEVDERMAEKCAREAAAEAALPEKLTDAEQARMKLEIASLLDAGETVLRALKRMGGGAVGGGAAARALASRGRGRSAATAQPPRAALAPAHRGAFERLTELSSALMACGEYDVYTFSKESFLRSAAALAPPATDMFGDDDDADMFADAPPPKRPAVEAAAGAAGASAAGAAAGAALDFSAWSVAQLRRFLEARGGSSAAPAPLEKRDLVDAAAAAAAQQQLAVPPGYAWHADSGFFACAASGLFFDLASGGFCDAQGAWYAWDATANAFVAWTQ
jgi:hypothetical protein